MSKRRHVLCYAYVFTVVVADDTLLTEPASQPLAGCDSGCTLLLNTTKDAQEIRALASHGGRICSADFTALALRLTHTLASLSTALGVAAARLVGLTLEQSLQGMDDELRDVALSASQHAANRQLAETVYAHAQSWAPVQERTEDADMMAYRLAEDERVMLPVLVNLDGFTLSFTREPVMLPAPAAVRAFLPP